MPSGAVVGGKLDFDARAYESVVAGVDCTCSCVSAWSLGVGCECECGCGWRGSAGNAEGDG